MTMLLVESDPQEKQLRATRLVWSAGCSSARKRSRPSAKDREEYLKKQLQQQQQQQQANNKTTNEHHAMRHEKLVSNLNAIARLDNDDDNDDDSLRPQRRGRRGTQERLHSSSWLSSGPLAGRSLTSTSNSSSRNQKSSARRRCRLLMSATKLALAIFLFLATEISLASSTNTPPTPQIIEGCKFYPIGENRRFERVAENLPVGSELFKIEAHPRSDFKIEPVDNSLSDVNYFKYVDLDDRFVAIKLNQSLEELVDRRDPQNVLKFKLTCRGIGSQEDSFLPVTVYIHDVNDHAPEFQNVPYHLEVDELTPVGLTIFRSIHAIDRDKPNTANSDITYSIVGGNDNDSFILSDPIEGILVMNKALDFDHGKREFKIQIQASDHGNPSLSSVTTMTIKVKDADDQNPVFSKEIYTASVSESAQITGKRIREKVRVEPAIMAYDQDTGINARLRYSIILGNEGGFFEMNAQTGELFLIREIDLEKLTTPTLSLQIQASQVDNPFRQALARVDILVQDINDNSPEFEYDMYNITVIENLPPNFTVLQVFATDNDQGENAQFKYVLYDDSGAFKIDPSSGWISVKDPTKLDRESTDHIRMHVTTVERKPNVNPDIGKRKRGTSVEINLLDSNDNTPFFVGAATQRPRDSTPAEEAELDAQHYANCLNVSKSASHQSGDSDCVVPINLYNFNVLETAAPGTQIGHVYAYDRDLGDNGRVQYFKQNDSISLGAPFDVNQLNGSIFVLPQFTRLAKKQSSYTLFVKAIDSAAIHFERRHSVAVIQINVTDINNSVPEFIGTTPFEAYVGESLPEGAFVAQVHARDDDSITEQLEFSIVAGNDEKLFIIDSKLGKIYTAAVLDYERKQSYDLLVQVSDGVNTAVAPLIINIIDINDQQPVFAHQFYNFTITEESGANQTVGQLLAMDRDSGKNAHLTYSIIGDHANDAFVLDPSTGILRTRRSLDCEQEPIIDFMVRARDGGIPQLSGTASVRVRVGDINDWAPRFEQARYELDVQEELEPPVDVATIKAHDKDRDENAIIKYLIIGGNELQLFSINADTGLLSTSGRLNYESKREHRLQIAARNVHPFQGPQARTIVNPAVEITIKVGDINDELVAFEKQSYHWRVSELTAKNTIIGRVNATNTHRGPLEQELTYWLGPVQVLQSSQLKRSRPNGTDSQQQQQVAAVQDKTIDKMAVLSTKLWIDEKSGEIILSEPLDRDAPRNEHLFKFSVFARDKRSINKLNASVPVIIDVIDVNDNPPTFDEPSYQLEMPENLPAGTTIPAFFKAHDLDSGLNGRIAAYYINGSREEMDTFHINNVTGTITLKTSLDYERQAVHKFEVLAMDGGSPTPLMGSAKVTIQVSNINEFSPKFTNLPYEFLLQENAVPGTQVGQVKAIDQDGNKIFYSMSDGDTEFFSIEQTSGKIYVSRQLVPRTQYSFIVRATDDGQPQNYSLGVQVILRVRDTNDHAPVFTSNQYVASVIEKQSRSPSGQQVLVKLEANDKDLQNNSISYSIVSGNDEGIFVIDKRTGEIRVAPQQAHRIDYDKRKQYTLLAQAQDSHEQPLVGLTMVQLNVLDVNDHAPIFGKAAYLASVNENSPPGSCFLRVDADSRDSNDAITYSLAWANQQQAQQGQQQQQQQPQQQQQSQQQSPPKQTGVNQLFEIHPIKGLICTKVPLDREQRAAYELLVTANDGKFESQAPVSIEIMDENDNRPIFDVDQYSISLPYDSQPGRSIISVHASDLDAGTNGQVQYWIKNTHGLFQIDAKTGQVRLVTRLPAPVNVNATQTFELKIFAQDQGSSPQIGETSLLIRLTNSENHPPKFDKFAYQVNIDENLSGVPLIQVQATDQDAGKAGKIVYRLVRVQAASLMQRSPSSSSGNALLLSSSQNTTGGSGNNGGGGSGSNNNGILSKKSQLEAQLASEQQLEYLKSAFKIDKSSGKIMLMEPLDFEETHNVELVIEARDESLNNDEQSTSAFVQVQVNDINDNKPEFLAMPRVLRISSSTQANSEIIYTVQAIDLDSSAQGNNQIEYRLETPSRYFNVHPQTGVLFAIAPLPSTLAEGGQTMPELEGEKLPSGATIYSETLTIVATDKSPTHPLMDKLTFDIEVYRDAADDAHPVFNSNQYFVQSDTSIEPGTVILAPKATVPNGDSISYNITSIETLSVAAASTTTTRGDKASRQQMQRALFKRFAIDQETGKISTTSKLEPSDSLAKNIYHFIVRATNRAQPQLSNEAGVVVRLWDTSLRCPRFPFTEYYASIAENARIDSVAVPNLVIDDVEKFAGQKLSYQITEDNSNDNFFIDVTTASTAAAATAGTTSAATPSTSVVAQAKSAGSNKIQVSLRVKKALDRESMPKFLAGMYTLTVSASNSKCATQARVKIMIEDQNDNSPTFDKLDYFVDLRENSPIGHVISQLQASDADELDAQRLRYFIADGAPSEARDVFEMEQKTGSISVRAEIDREKASKYVLRIMAVDQANNTGWTNLHVNVLDENDWAPAFQNETFFMNATEGPSSLGTRIRLPVFDYDDGLNRQMEVYIVEGNAGNEFRLDVDEGGPLLTIVQELDWEKYAQLEWSPLAKMHASQQQVSAASTAVHTIQIAAKDKGVPARIGKTSVLVFIHDINDNSPKFTHESYYEFIDENAPVGSVVAQVRATDADSPLNTNLTYSFVRRATSGLAQQQQQQMQPIAPALSSMQSQQQNSTPMASNRQQQAKPAQQQTGGGSGQATAAAAASQPVGLIARPRQLRPSGSGGASPLLPSGSLDTAVQQPQPLHNNRRRLVKRQAASGGAAASQGVFPFALDPQTGVVSVARQLDISEQQQYLLTIEAFDGLWRTETQMRIFINEVEDPRDVSARSSEATNHYRFSVHENAPEALVGQVDLKPRKLRVNSQMRYSIVNIEMRQLFRISESGEILTLRGLDREQRAQYTFTVMLEEKRGSSKLTVAEVIVDVIDENDEIPTFMNVYHGTIKENSPPGTPVFLLPTTSIRAVDNDTRNNSQITYALTGSGSDRFAIQPSGAVHFLPADETIILDREQRADYKLDVHATDNGNLSSKTTLTIKIEDENDNAPIFETGPLFVLIPETAKAGSKIVQVKARDRDELGPNSEIHYRISASTFHSAQAQQHQLSDVIRIDSATGELFVVGQLQPASSYNISVTATDSGGLAAQQQVNVTVIDVNDHKPVFERPAYSFVVFEGNYSRGALKLGTLRATDDDLGANSQIEYLLLTDPQYEASIPIANPANNLASLLQSQHANAAAAAGSSSSTFPISIDVHTGELFARGPIDREQRDTFIFKVMALDLGEPQPLNSTCEVTIKVKDINDEPPRFYTDPYLALVPENLEPGHKVTQIAAFDPDSGENGQVFYKLGEGHEGKFYIDGKDGTVWTLASLDYEQKNFYNITIIAYDRGTPSLHSTAKLWITVADMNDAVPNFAKAVYTLEVAENAKLGDTIFALNAGKGAFKYSWLSSSASSQGISSSGSSNTNNHHHSHQHHQHQHQHAQDDQLNLDRDGQETFSIEPSSGHIKLAKPLDSVQRNHYRLMVKAQDESEPPKFDTAEVNILVGTGQGVRLFSQRVYEIGVLENQLAPLLLIDLNCTDEMIHQPVSYSIVGSDHRGLFRIEPDTGRVSVTSSLDRERRESYVIKIKAETGGLNVRQKRDTRAQQQQQQQQQQRPASSSQMSGAAVPPAVHPTRWSASTLTSSTTPPPISVIQGRNRLISDLNELESKFYGQSARLIAGSSSSSNASALQNLHLAYDETFVLIVVEDENDNAPVFSSSGSGNGASNIIVAGALGTAAAAAGDKSQLHHRTAAAAAAAAAAAGGPKPIVAAVPLEASFGYEIARIQARDADSGVNAQIRYEIQSRHDDASTKFYIDPTSGVIRSMVNFALDSGRVYNFDVRATDREGLDSGNSALIQVYVYVLPETKMVLMVTDTEPIIMEKRSHEVIGYLSNVTGFEVKLAKLEPHIEGEAPEPFSTDLFLYAVNPSLNNIVDTETLLNVFRQSSQTILSHLHAFKIRRIQGVTVQEKISQMGATEIAIIALSSIVFIGSIVAILLLCSCKHSAGQRQGNGANGSAGSNNPMSSSTSSQQSIWDQQRAYSLKNPLMNGLAGKLGGGASGCPTPVGGGPHSPSSHLNHHHHHHNINGGQGATSGHIHASGPNGTNGNNGHYTPRQTSNSTYSTGDGANSSEYVDSLISYKRSSGGSHKRVGAGGGANQQLAAAAAAAGGAGASDQLASGRGAKSRNGAEWSAVDSDLALAMQEHHLHHLQHHHHHHHHPLQHHAHAAARGTPLGAAAAAAGPIASAIGGLPEGAFKGPRARLARPGNGGTMEEHDEIHDPNTEVHSDNEVFGDEDDEDEMHEDIMMQDGRQQHQMADVVVNGVSDNSGQHQHIMIEQHHVSGGGLKQLGSANHQRHWRDNDDDDDDGSVRSADRSIYSGESNYDSNNDDEQQPHHNSRHHNNHHHQHRYQRHTSNKRPLTGNNSDH